MKFYMTAHKPTTEYSLIVILLRSVGLEQQ
ncbi:hypothetical protein ABH901_002582 [Mammaliicoccus lentus]|jgi:hypothetical protein|nr:Uncharacterised protein [Mammaliicoccus lentus]SUM51356.1 Uncharacterised protein [Mammaliicoccus lentus]